MIKLTTLVAVTLGSALIGGCSSMSSLPTLGGASKVERGSSLGRPSSLRRTLSLGSGSNSAADNGDQLSRGLYAVAGVGPSRLEPDATAVPEYTVNDRVEPAGQLTIGADLTKHLSIEGHTADLGSAGFSPDGRINYHVTGASALVYAGGNRDRHRRQGMTAYGRVGVGALENSAEGSVPFTKVNKTHLLVGAGVEYMTSIGVGLRAEGISFDDDVKYAQVGLMYRTGGKLESTQPKLAEVPVAAPVPAPPAAAAIPSQCAAVSGVLEGVGFHSDSAGLTPQSIQVLDQVAYTLSTCEETLIHVQAHTDAQGSASYNQDLSRKRAFAVVNYLNSSGLDKSRMQATAFGESQPIDTNETASGRERNRRVEVHIR